MHYTLREIKVEDLTLNDDFCDTAPKSFEAGSSDEEYEAGGVVWNEIWDRYMGSQDYAVEGFVHIYGRRNSDETDKVHAFRVDVAAVIARGVPDGITDYNDEAEFYDNFKNGSTAYPGRFFQLFNVDDEDNVALGDWVAGAAHWEVEDGQAGTWFNSAVDNPTHLSRPVLDYSEEEE